MRFLSRWFVRRSELEEIKGKLSILETDNQLHARAFAGLLSRLEIEEKASYDRYFISEREAACGEDYSTLRKEMTIKTLLLMILNHLGLSLKRSEEIPAVPAEFFLKKVKK